MSRKGPRTLLISSHVAPASMPSICSASWRVSCLPRRAAAPTLSAVTPDFWASGGLKGPWKGDSILYTLRDWIKTRVEHSVRCHLPGVQNLLTRAWRYACVAARNRTVAPATARLAKILAACRFE
ncbi:hypothetical protein F751_2477 [Auxenochlorella protothecoides]|uniref:Uncharacterized protein n=1 Tax=Auxenochlorella protothecoides TaxID=3075 RepID=A0A087SIT1_AUXPR|nr:hypothetical protein F751_2477 [Auxenochlorella protothecoides]KFM25635.1 hypothetical protein F751_2477 [Auxenochlorella protothecoides]